MIQTMKTEDNCYIVSEDGTWVEGRYESESDAKLACKKDYVSLHEAFEQSHSQGREGLITHEQLMSM